MSSTVHPEALPHRRPMAMPGWGITVIALVLLVAAVAAGIVIGQNTAAEEAAPAAEAVTTVPPANIADAETTAMVDDMLAAWSSGDGRETASYFTTDATVYNDIGGYTKQGSEAIAKNAQAEGEAGVLVRRDSPVVGANGEFFSHAFNWSGGYGITVYEMRYDGLISNMWIYGY